MNRLELKAVSTGAVNNPAAVRFRQKNGCQIVGGPELMPDSTGVFHLCKHVTGK